MNKKSERKAGSHGYHAASVTLNEVACERCEGPSLDSRDAPILAAEFSTSIPARPLVAIIPVGDGLAERRTLNEVVRCIHCGARLIVSVSLVIHNADHVPDKAGGCGRLSCAAAARWRCHGCAGILCAGHRIDRGPHSYCVPCAVGMLSRPDAPQLDTLALQLAVERAAAERESVLTVTIPGLPPLVPGDTLPLYFVPSQCCARGGEQTESDPLPYYHSETCAREDVPRRCSPRCWIGRKPERSRFDCDTCDAPVCSQHVVFEGDNIRCEFCARAHDAATPAK